MQMQQMQQMAQDQQLESSGTENSAQNQSQLPMDTNTIEYQTTGLLVQKPLTSKPYIPTIDQTPQPIIDPSGLSIEKPLVNKALKLQWLPPGVASKDKAANKEVLEKSGISITKASNIKYDHLVLEVKEKPKEEEKPVEENNFYEGFMPNNQGFLPPPAPSFFKMPEILPAPRMTQMSFMSDQSSEGIPHFTSSADELQESTNQQQTTTQDITTETKPEQVAVHEPEQIVETVQEPEPVQIPVQNEPEHKQEEEHVQPPSFTSTISQIKIIPRLDMVDSSTDISSAPGDQELEQMRYEHQAYQEILKSKQEESTTSTVSPPIFGAFNQPFRSFTSQSQSNTTNSYFSNSSLYGTSTFGQAPSNPFGFSQPTIPNAPKAPVFPFAYQTPTTDAQNEEDQVQPIFIPTAQDLERNKSNEELLPTTYPEQSEDSQRKEATSEFSSDVYGQLETDKSSPQEENQQQEEPQIIQQPIIDNDIDDLLGIV